LLNDLRVPAKIAQEQLGHASISTTLNIYTPELADVSGPMILLNRRSFIAKRALDAILRHA
jgi:integrase